MGSMEAALMALVILSALGVVMADGEMRRLHWVQAMRRALLRMNDAICYERPELCTLLRGVNLRTTIQERELSRLLSACADDIQTGTNEGLLSAFVRRSSQLNSFGVVSREDREAFELVLGELGRCGMKEQLRLIETADERLRSREDALRHEGRQRARLIRTLGFCSGAAAFLVLI